MIQRPTDNAGFTLIELMIVLAIVAAMAVLAFGSVQSQLPAQRLNTATRDLMSALQQARGRSIRTGQPTKVCLYRSAAGTFKNRYQVLQCNIGEVCADPLTDVAICTDTTTNGVIAAEVGVSPKKWDFPSAITVPVGGGTYENIQGNFSSDDFRNVELQGFLDAANAMTAVNVLEVAFTSSGTINQALTTPDAGSVMFTRIRLRTVDASTTMTPFRDLRYTLGGGVRINK